MCELPHTPTMAVSTAAERRKGRWIGRQGTQGRGEEQLHGEMPKGGLNLSFSCSPTTNRHVRTWPANQTYRGHRRTDANDPISAIGGQFCRDAQRGIRTTMW